jgi:Fe-S-cluster containining protein
MTALAGQQTRPIVCPLLDQPTGACMVYAQRPVACRSYGFYVQRELGLYCQGIESRVAEGALADVVWGNHDAIDHRLGGLGEILALTEWFDRWATEKIAASRCL